MKKAVRFCPEVIFLPGGASHPAIQIHGRPSPMSIQPFIQYKIVLGSEPNELECGVNGMLNLGWVPLGGVTQYHEVWKQQAGVRRTEIHLVQAMALPANASNPLITELCGVLEAEG
jgi:hypothetical protein